MEGRYGIMTQITVSKTGCGPLIPNLASVLTSEVIEAVVLRP